MIFSDAISDNNLLQMPFIAHDIEIQAIHPHLLKWPVVLLENTLGFNLSTHTIISVGLLLLMNIWLGYLLFKFSHKNIPVTALSLILLASVELLTGISANEGTLSMITIRNIELPMTIWLLTTLFKQTKILNIRTAFIAILLSIIFVSDQLILYTTIVGTVLYLLWSVVTRKTFHYSELTDKPLYLTVMIAAVLAKIITKLFAASGIAHFYERSSDGLLYAKSFNDLFENSLAYIGKIFDVFGAGFFGRQIFDGPIYALNIIVLILSIYLTYKFIIKTKKIKNQDIEQKTIVFLLASYFFAMLIFTVLIPRELGGRYFAFLPVIGLLLFAYSFRSFRLKNTPKSTIYTIVLLLGFVILFLYMASGANRIYYNQKYDAISKKLGDTSTLIRSLTDNSITVYIDQDYWRNHIIKQQYDQKTNSSLAIPSVYCGGVVVDKQFSRKSWSQANGNRVAVRVKECDGPSVERAFGAPQKIIKLGEGDHLYLYDHDIRQVLDLREYNPEHVKL